MKLKDKHMWIWATILSLILISAALYVMILPERTINFALKSFSGSTLTINDLNDEVVISTILFAARVLWLVFGLTFGVFGLLCAWGLKQGKSFAQELWFMWGVLLIMFGILLGLYEFLMGWSMVCPAVIMCIVVGAVAILPILSSRRFSEQKYHGIGLSVTMAVALAILLSGISNAPIKIFISPVFNFWGGLLEIFGFALVMVFAWLHYRKTDLSSTIAFFLPIFLIAAFLEGDWIRRGIFEYHNLNIFIWGTPLAIIFYWSIFYLMKVVQ